LKLDFRKERDIRNDGIIRLYTLWSAKKTWMTSTTILRPKKVISYEYWWLRWSRYFRLKSPEKNGIVDREQWKINPVRPIEIRIDRGRVYRIQADSKFDRTIWTRSVIDRSADPFYQRDQWRIQMQDTVEKAYNVLKKNR
jgi:hypothetical protein